MRWFGQVISTRLLVHRALNSRFEADVESESAQWPIQRRPELLRPLADDSCLHPIQKAQQSARASEHKPWQYPIRFPSLLWRDIAILRLWYNMSQAWRSSRITQFLQFDARLDVINEHVPDQQSSMHRWSSQPPKQCRQEHILVPRYTEDLQSRLPVSISRLLLRLPLVTIPSTSRIESWWRRQLRQHVLEVPAIRPRRSRTPCLHASARRAGTAYLVPRRVANRDAVDRGRKSVFIGENMHGWKMR